MYNSQGRVYWKRNEVTDEEWKKSRSQAARNKSSLGEEIAGLLCMMGRFTIDHVSPVLTGYCISHLHPFADDNDGFAIGTRCHRAVAFPVTGGTGHRLGLGYREGRGETQERQGSPYGLSDCS